MRDVERQGWNPGQMCGLDDEQSSLPACPRVRAWTWAQASGCRANSSKEVLHAPRIPEAPEYSYMTGTWVCPQKAGSACVVSNQALFTKIKKKPPEGSLWTRSWPRRKDKDKGGLLRSRSVSQIAWHLSAKQEVTLQGVFLFLLANPLS